MQATNPFVGPEAIERDHGHVFRARVGANESAFGMSPRAREAAQATLATLSWYGDPENYELRAALASHHGVEVGEVLVAAGIDDLLGLLVRAFATDGGRAVMAAGSYPTFAYHTASYGVPLDLVPYSADDQVDLAALANQAVLSAGASGHSGHLSATLVYLANPDNPSGHFMPIDDVLKHANTIATKLGYAGEGELSRESLRWIISHYGSNGGVWSKPMLRAD